MVAEGAPAGGEPGGGGLPALAALWWWRQVLRDTVPQSAPAGAELLGQTSFWSVAGSRRWQAAVDRERASGLTVRDGDPLTPHYSWSLAREGAASGRLFTLERAAGRLVVASGSRWRRDVDPTRVLVSVRGAVETRR
jgi:hypothetical protein